MKVVKTAPHEYRANYLYNEHGLRPWFGLDNAVKSGDGSISGEFQYDGVNWEATLSYRSSNIIHPGERTPEGTEWTLNADETTDRPTLRREYKLSVERIADPAGQQSFSAHIAPRWPDMKGLTDNGSTVDISPPEGFGEGLNCKLTGSNIEFQEYERLLALGLDSCDVSAHYFKEVHEYSNILDAERYVRIHTDESGPIHARDGPLAELSHLLENDREGYRKIVENDEDISGRNLPGYYHTATLGPRRISEAWPGHQLPKEIKHYYAKRALDKSRSDPLRHPKLGASYQNSRSEDTLRVSDIEQLNDELSETVHSVLNEAGLSVQPAGGNGPYVPDAYFEPELREIEGRPITLNLSHIRQEQESILVRNLSGGISPVQWDCLDHLVTDGGEVSPADIAEEKDRHVGSVRRALRAMNEMVDREYGSVGLRSEHIAQMCRDAVKEARESVNSALELGEKVMQAAEQGLSDGMAEWVAWCERYGIDISNRREALEIDLGERDCRYDGHGPLGKSVSITLRSARDMWENANQDPERFRNATVKVRCKHTGATYERKVWQVT